MAVKTEREKKKERESFFVLCLSPQTTSLVLDNFTLNSFHFHIVLPDIFLSRLPRCPLSPPNHLHIAVPKANQLKTP